MNAYKTPARWQRHVSRLAFLLLLGAGGTCFAQSAAPAACPALPTTAPTAATSPEQLAWQIFAAINCQTTDKRLTWETWTEQTCIINPSASGCSPTGNTKNILHGSSLQAKSGKGHGAVRAAAPSIAASKDNLDNLAGHCNAMTNAKTSGVGASLPFVPANLNLNKDKNGNPLAVFCEEVYVNDAELKYIQSPAGPGTNLQSLQGQLAYVASGNKINFPTDSVELKVDWVPAISLMSAKNTTQPAFDCDSNKLTGVYTKKIEGVCYALVGIHISSKLYKNWLWATFEPQNGITNPNRCKSNLYSNCTDSWGSNPAVVANPSKTNAPTTQTSQLTAAAKALLASANLDPAFLNYRLTGIQTTYGAGGAASMLGNSFTEFNAGVLPQQSSCITCHANAVFSSPLVNPNFAAFPGFPTVGTPKLPTQNSVQWNSLDFSWLLGFMNKTPPTPPTK